MEHSEYVWAVNLGIYVFPVIIGLLNSSPLEYTCRLCQFSQTMWTDSLAAWKNTEVSNRLPLSCQRCQVSKISKGSEWQRIFLLPWVDAVFYSYLPFIILFTFNVLIIWSFNKAHKRQKNLHGDRNARKSTSQNRHSGTSETWKLHSLYKIKRPLVQSISQM
jgi:hypothetical protein